MNRKIIMGVGVTSATLVAITGAVGMTLSLCSVSYECKIEFCYQDGVPSAAVVSRGDNALGEIGPSIQDRYRSLVLEFADKQYFPFPLEKMVRRCMSDAKLQNESEKRTRSVLSTMRLDVTGVPCTNYVYPCRLVLSSGEKRNLGEYGSLCLTMVKERLQEENSVYADKAALNEIVQMRKVERRIKELEKHVEDGSGTESAEAELEQAKQTVQKMQKRIEEIRKDVMSRCAQRIICESPPEVSWVMRRKERNERQSR